MFTLDRIPVIPWVPLGGNPPWMFSSEGGSSTSGLRLDKSRKTKIIVIDDESLIAETLLEILQHEGFEAISASSGSSALELARDWQPDIVLSDVIMPGLDGVETGIRVREINPRCKVILFSGQAATVDLLEHARHRGHQFEILAKPIRPEELISVIRRAATEIS